MDEKIDFVITWGDVNDPKWQKNFEYYSAKKGRTIDKSTPRCRDWETLRYWFRGVRKHAPWVNKIFFVTYGHLPKWLNTDNPKLVIIKHEEFIPVEYLPIFSNNSIEFFFHRIEGLSERFVYFNDDMFIINTVSPDRSFRNGLPYDIGGLYIATTRDMYGFSIYMVLNLIREYFNKKESVSQNRSKWYFLRYPRLSLQNLLKRKRTKFTEFTNHHQLQGYLKKTYDDVWKHCEKNLHRTCSNKFRTYRNTTPWLLRYWQLASGPFTPYYVFKEGRVFSLSDKRISESVDCITHQKKKLVCLNDGEYVIYFKEYKEKLINALEQIFPPKMALNCK